MSASIEQLLLQYPQYWELILDRKFQSHSINTPSRVYHVSLATSYLDYVTEAVDEAQPGLDIS